MPLSLLLWMTTNPDKSLLSVCLSSSSSLLPPSPYMRPSWLFLCFLCCLGSLFSFHTDMIYSGIFCLFVFQFCVAWVVLFTSKPDIVCPVQSVKPSGALKSCRVLSVHFVLGKRVDGTRKKTQGKEVISVIQAIPYLSISKKKKKNHNLISGIKLTRVHPQLENDLVPSLHLLFACDSVMT